MNDIKVYLLSSQNLASKQGETNDQNTWFLVNPLINHWLNDDDHNWQNIRMWRPYSIATVYLISIMN